MKITKEILKQIIKEEIEAINENPLAGPTTAGPTATTTSGAPNPLAGATRTDQPEDVKKKAVALDQVEALLTKLLQQIRQL